MANKKLFLLCSCGTETIMIESDRDYKNFYAAFYKLGFTGKLSFKQRLRYIFKVLFSGEPYNDMTVLTIEDIESLYSFLGTELKAIKEQELSNLTEPVTQEKESLFKITIIREPTKDTDKEKFTLTSNIHSEEEFNALLNKLQGVCFS